MNKVKNKQIIILVLISLLPFIIAFILFKYNNLLTLKTTHHGELISPPIKVFIDAPRHWLISFVSLGNCDDSCKDILFSLNQLKKALGRNSKRVEIVSDQSIVVENLINENKSLDNLSKTLGLRNEFSNKIIIIDPAGYLMMAYPSNINFMFILKDMKRLLEVSQIG